MQAVIAGIVTASTAPSLTGLHYILAVQAAQSPPRYAMSAIVLYPLPPTAGEAAELATTFADAAAAAATGASPCGSSFTGNWLAVNPGLVSITANR